jgi:exo-beta-1,3-glucanase (GH17 family)
MARGDGGNRLAAHAKYQRGIGSSNEGKNSRMKMIRKALKVHHIQAGKVLSFWALPAPELVLACARLDILRRRSRMGVPSRSQSDDQVSNVSPPQRASIMTALLNRLRASALILAVVSLALLCAAAASPTPTPGPTPAYRLHGLDFSPCIDGQDPNQGSQVSEAQLRARMAIIASYTQWIRTFGCGSGLEKAGQVAHELGLQSAIGAWLSADSVANGQQIACLTTVGQAGQADMLIVGSEVLLRGDLTEGQLIGYINQVKEAVPGVPVATADFYGELIAHPSVLAAGDVVLANFYPYWEGIDVQQAVASLQYRYQQVEAVAGGKQVLVSETGWPSGGNPYGNAVPSPENATFYFRSSVSWARAGGVGYFYFEAFDETWKATYEGPQGAHWGVWDKDGNLKPGMEDVFWPGAVGGIAEPAREAEAHSETISGSETNRRLLFVVAVAAAAGVIAVCVSLRCLRKRRVD